MLSYGWVSREEKGSLARSKNEKTWNVSGGLFKRVANKGPSVESGESVTQVTFTAVKQSTNGLGAHWAMMAARAQWGREKEWGTHWDIMDTGAEGGRVTRAGVDECSCKSYPCVTLKPNTYLLSCKMAVSARPPLMGTVEPPVRDRFSATAGHARLVLPYPVNPAVHIGFEPITVRQVVGADSLINQYICSWTHIHGNAIWRQLQLQISADDVKSQLQ